MRITPGNVLTSLTLLFVVLLYVLKIRTALLIPQIPLVGIIFIGCSLLLTPLLVGRAIWQICNDENNEWKPLGATVLSMITVAPMALAGSCCFYGCFHSELLFHFF